MTNNNSRPTVSVVMCTFNGEKFIKEQLDSILTQTYPIDEIIVQDDCSSDSTAEIVREYARNQHPIKLFVNDHNVGFNSNFRQVLARASCDFVAISDQDDIWYPSKIERQIRAIGDKDICGTAYDIGESIGDSHYRASSDCIERSVFIGGMAGHVMLISRDFLQSRNQWLDGIAYDWSLLMNAYLGKGVVALEEALNWHRRHDKALGNVFAKENRSNRQNNIYPYIHGWGQYRNLQKKQSWQTMYAFIHNHTDEAHEPLAHQLAGLMLRPGLAALMRLCYTCWRNKQIIYPDKQKAAGLAGSLRALAFPAIFAYNNYHFDWAD